MPFGLFRLRSYSASAHLPSSEEESSPERDRACIVRVPAPKNDRKSGGHFLAVSKGTTDKARESTHIPLTLDKAPLPARPPKRPHKSGVVSVSHPTDAVDILQPTPKPTLIRRVTSKLNISIPSRSGTTQALRSRPSTRTLPSDMGPLSQGPRSPKPTIPPPPTLPNSFVSKQHREAALRERGLLPPRKDLSEQEREADQQLDCVPSPVGLTLNGSTEAERLKANWLAVNRTSESSDSDCGPPVPLHSQSTSSSTPDSGAARRSSEGKADLPPAGRPSFCSSVPPLSTSSCLEVLHEEPSEQGPITPLLPLPPAKLSIFVSSPFESPPSPMLVESPVSCTFSSHHPGSTLESQSQSSHRPSVPDKENIRLYAARRRTSDAGDRSRKVVGSSLSKFGTHSLTNLRRSVAGSLRAPSSSTLASGDRSSLISQAPRTAIDPTMHSIGSIIRETRDIKDAESRRLSELAFLD